MSTDNSSSYLSDGLRSNETTPKGSGTPLPVPVPVRGATPTPPTGTSGLGDNLSQIFQFIGRSECIECSHSLVSWNSTIPRSEPWSFSFP